MVGDGRDKYSLTRHRFLASTASASLYTATYSLRPGQIVAVKTLRPTDASTGARHWLREVSSHHGVGKHSGIVTFYGCDARTFSIYMEYVDSPALNMLRDESDMCSSQEAAFTILEDIASALEHVHASLLIHNDIKPSNILLHPRRGAILIDFGLCSKSTEEASSGGTPWYVPPEYLTTGERGSLGDVIDHCFISRTSSSFASGRILALFDIVKFVDDSFSMTLNNGKRVRDIMRVLSRVASAATLFDQDGVTVRFINSTVHGDKICNETDVNRLIQSANFSGRTPIGTEMRRKILDPLVLQPARKGQLQLPVLIIAITDSKPQSEDKQAIFQAIKDASDELDRTPLGAGAVAYQFTQVGEDEDARRFLNRLDTHPQIGSLVDVTSSLEIEQEEMSRINPSMALTADFWTLKLLLGYLGHRR